jgi:tellurite resistance protein
MSDTKKFKIVVDSKGAEKGLKKTSKGLKDVGKSSKASSKGFKMMGTAMKAMGIGLIIAVVAKLTEMMIKNQKVQDLVARVMDTLGKVMNVVIDIMFEALKVIDKLTFGMLNLSGEADGATKSLQKQRNEYELLEAGMEKIKLQYETQIEKLRQIRDNESLTMEERIAASDAIAKTLDQQYATERARILEMIQVKKNLLKADRHNIELKKELLAVETMLAELDNRITSQRSEQLQSFNSLKSSQAQVRLLKKK